MVHAFRSAREVTDVSLHLELEGEEREAQRAREAALAAGGGAAGGEG